VTFWKLGLSEATAETRAYPHVSTTPNTAAVTIFLRMSLRTLHESLRLVPAVWEPPNGVCSNETGTWVLVHIESIWAGFRPSAHRLKARYYPKPAKTGIAA
jgi:hypothetical protein